MPRFVRARIGGLTPRLDLSSSSIALFHIDRIRIRLCHFSVSPECETRVSSFPRSFVPRAGIDPTGAGASGGLRCSEMIPSRPHWGLFPSACLLRLFNWASSHSGSNHYRHLDLHARQAMAANQGRVFGKQMCLTNSGAGGTFSKYNLKAKLARPAAKREGERKIEVRRKDLMPSTPVPSCWEGS